MSRLELFIDNPDILGDIMKYIDKHEVNSRIFSKKDDIYDTYIQVHGIPVSSTFVYLSPTVSEKLNDMTRVIPSRHLKLMLGPENLNKYGETKRSSVYKFIDEYIKNHKLDVLNDTVYLNNFLRNLLCVSCNTMTIINIYETIDKMLTDKI